MITYIVIYFAVAIFVMCPIVTLLMGSAGGGRGYRGPVEPRTWANYWAELRPFLAMILRSVGLFAALVAFMAAVVGIVHLYDAVFA